MKWAETVTCVVRSVGERTTSACVASLAKQLSDEPVVVSVDVHREMVRRTFETALDAGKPLLLAVDADVLPYVGAVSSILELANLVPQNYFLVSGRIDDHLLGVARVGGLRVYRTQHLRKALGHLERSGSMRPESGLIKPMAAHGAPTAVGSRVLGVHDAEQYLFDVYRKGFFYAHRNLDLVPDLVRRWRGVETGEAKSLLAGISNGLLAKEAGPDFANHDAQSTRELLAGLGLEERRSMAPDYDSLRVVGPSPEAWWTDPRPTRLSHVLTEKRRNGHSLPAAAARVTLRGVLRRLDGESAGG